MKQYRRSLNYFLISLLTLVMVGCASLAPTPPEKPDWQPGKIYHLTILHTNDHHGRFWQNEQGEYGLAARKTLIDNIREEVALNDGYTMLLSGGDINTGVPESDLQDAEPDFLGMRMLHYDAMALGNHEFDNPRAVLEQQQKWAGFPFLSANIIDKKTGKPLFQAYKIFKEGDLKIAVVGFTTDDTAKLGNPEYLKGLEIKSPIEVAKALIPKLRKQADLIIAITHMGHYKNGSHGGNAPGDVSLARAVPGIDVIIGGHSQTPLFKPDVQNGTLILQAHEWGKYVGRLDLTYEDGKITHSSYKLIPVNLKKNTSDQHSKDRLIEDDIPQDPDMINLLTPYQEKGEQALNTQIGKATGDFIGDRHQIRHEETNLGNLIARAMKEAAHADLAVMNSGGIRDSLPEGAITYKSVLKVQPFGNTLAYVTLNADQLTDYLSAVASMPPGTGAFAQFQGVSLTLKSGKATHILINGKPLEQGRTYRLATNNYSANGGDGYPKLTDLPSYVNTGDSDADLLVQYIKQHSPLNPDDYAPTGAIQREP
ncbi:bifunctional UDP-sugar hydrolase/5'-nucleotidase UshA [Marinomonas spartinae]|uniref:bifunctional UDP-sugar hydrolase/5'-nucleotidase UshA n=1 Tax=Marinomonas spartinae TaxID=1792290 RepID=UPI0018F211BF|nr:bifunctional UDP-sugar hydrolase/5'-nucleotidase UshA [Marinomonas spartinae]MBJ7556038.1 bifunctional UDP-sugar hydrolase/5'-nucleotidase [Marinomonas spartinae]